jgi:hypothetical protein
VIDIANPAVPQQAGWFPQPVEQVATQDPALSGGANKVVMWSYPIIKGGLIYAVDIRNSLATGARLRRDCACSIPLGQLHHRLHTEKTLKRD